MLANSRQEAKLGRHHDSKYANKVMLVHWSKTILTSITVEECSRHAL